MKIIADIHGYPPYHNSGAEWMLHSMLRHLSGNHEICVLLNFDTLLLGEKVTSAYEVDGIKVVSDKEDYKYYPWADIVITHLDKTGRAYNLCKRHNKPMVHIFHNNYHNSPATSLNGVSQYAVYNTDWVSKDRRPVNKMILGSMVVHPPVFVRDYRCRKINNYITLINLNPNKGGDFLIELAKKMPDRKFMGVMGSYGEQKLDRKLKNIHYVTHTANITEHVYCRTRILLMPSKYESYGRTAVEAMASGTPVICTETPGLLEAVADAGIYCKRENINEWIDAIKLLDDKEFYKAMSKKATSRANGLNPEKELNLFEQFLIKIYESHYFKNTRNVIGQRPVYGRA